MKKLFILLALAGCGGASSDAALGDLKTRLTEAQRKEADARKRIDELENRVFLMNDQIESARVAQSAARSPRLPVVTLRPSEEGREESPRSDRPGEDEPEFTGAARSADAGHVRPVLRGDGDFGGVSEPRKTVARRSAPTPAPEPTRFVAQGGGDSLGVAPVPPIPKSSAIERAPALPAATRAHALDLPAGREGPPIDNEPLVAYRAAYSELTAGRYEDAEQKLRAFVKRWPRHDYADNAQYWLGESYYARHRYREAAVEFRAAVAKYPVGNKAPDALLKLAYSLLSLNETAEARRLLEELPQSYPRSEAARLATQKLTELGARAGSNTSPEDSRVNARTLVVVLGFCGGVAHAQQASDLMPAPPAATPGQVQLPYTQTLPGAPAPVVPRAVINGPAGAAEKAPPGRKGYDIYEPTSMFPGDERYGSRVETDRVPDTHVVKKGDTLWDIANYYFRNPWSWPKLWALNPSITNPHWIYPGDLVRLMPTGDQPGPAPISAIAPQRPQKKIRTDGILLRQTGFIEPDELKNAGKIIASKEEKILLGTLDEAYVEMNKSRPLRVGERYTIFRPLEDVKHPVSKKKLGTLVQILGEAEVKAVTDGNIARVQIVDATDPIERGYLVGALRRQFKMVEPVRNNRELEGVVVVGLRPLKLVHSENLLFIDKGKDDGVVVGNRFIVTRRGDGYQPILATGPIDDRRFPKEVIGEILIIDTRQNLATGLVTRSTKEARLGDRVELRKGY